MFGFLANGDTRHATIAFNAGILPTCVERLSSGDLEARIKSAWILGNLAADNAECAEALMERRVLEIMFEQMTTITNANEISSHGPYSSMLLWAINHFLKSTPGLTPNIVSVRFRSYLSHVTSTTFYLAIPLRKRYIHPHDLPSSNMHFFTTRSYRSKTSYPPSSSRTSKT